MERKNPPKKRKIFLLAYGAAVDSMFATPSIGKKTKGIKAVTAIGTASVAHQIPIQTKIAAALLASMGSDSLAGMTRIIRAATNPKISPYFDFLFSDMTPK